MQTEKFTIFDYEQLQNSTKKTHYEEIIKWATTIRISYVNYTLLNYATRRADKMLADIPISYYITRANEIIKGNRDNYEKGNAPVLLKTANEKMLFITSLVFPNNDNFISTLEQYGIKKEDCLNFGEETKTLGFYDENKTAMILELLMQEYFPDLDLIKTHYGTNNTGIIINKILEIAYLHPELLHTKEKS